MGFIERDRPVCESCRLPEAAGVMYDRDVRRWTCRSCWQLLGPPSGTPAHPEDRPDWKPEIRRRLD